MEYVKDIEHIKNGNTLSGILLWIVSQKGHAASEKPARRKIQDWGGPGNLDVPLLGVGWSHGHLSQTCDRRASHCQSCNEICMKHDCWTAGPKLINVSILSHPVWNTFTLHYLFMQSVLCILIPPPVIAHYNEVKFKLCSKFKVVPLPQATYAPHCHSHCWKLSFFWLCLVLFLWEHATTMTQLKLPQTTANIFLVQSCDN